MTLRSSTFLWLGRGDVTSGGKSSEMDAIYIAVEASIPGLLGLATLVSLKTSQPLIRTLILNDSVFDVEKITVALEEIIVSAI